VSTPQAVLSLAITSLGAGDLAGLESHLTAGGVERVRRDLAAWGTVLADPQTGPRVLARLGKPATPEEAALRSRALAGDLPSLLRVYAKAAPPRIPAPAPAPATPATTRASELLYEAFDGSQRRVVLVRDGDRWRIDQIQI
jgi:hypothetical protein